MEGSTRQRRPWNAACRWVGARWRRFLPAGVSAAADSRSPAAAAGGERKETRASEHASADRPKGTLDVEALYREYGDMVYGRCYNLLGNELDARETTQEVFLRLHRYRKRFRGDSSPATYLFHITTTTCLNRRRTRRRRPEELVEEPHPLQTNDTLLESIQLRDLVDKVLARTDSKTRAILIYRHADGMTHAEVGKMVGLSAAAVRKRIARFRKSLEHDPPPWLVEEGP